MSSPIRVLHRGSRGIWYHALDGPILQFQTWRWTAMSTFQWRDGYWVLGDRWGPGAPGAVPRFIARRAALLRVR